MTTGDSDDSPAASSSHEDSNDVATTSPPGQSTWSQPVAVENGRRVATHSSSSVAMLGFGVGGRPSAKRAEVDTHVIQVANIAPQATKEQMMALFGYIGKIEDLRLYPTMDIGMQHTSKICFVKFRDTTCVGVAQHLTNTVFVDRALIVIPYTDGEAPDEAKGIELLNSGSVLPGVADPKLPQHVTSQLEGIPPQQVVVTSDPKLVELQLPVYPNLPPTYDSRRIEEIRRTILLANIDSDVTAHDLLELFGNAGEIKYLRMCTRDNDPLLYALVEFTEQPSVLSALQCNGTLMGTKHIKVYHSTQAIVKPQAKTNEAAQKEIEEAMTRTALMQAQNLITQGLDSNGNAKEKRRSTSPPRGRHTGSRVGPPTRRSRTRSPRRRSGSRSRRRRSRTRSRSPRRSSRRNSRSHSRGRVLRSPWGHRSRSRSKEIKRSTSKSRRSKRSSSKDKGDKRREKEKKPKRDKDKERDKEKERKSKDRERESRDKGKENGVKLEEPPKEDAIRERDRGDRHKDRDRKKDKKKSRSKSPIKEKRRSTSRERRKRSKNKKKKRGDDDRDESMERRISDSPNNSGQLMDVD